MKKIGFIGAYDKTDLLVNIAKVLTEMKNKVLIIDSTINQKAKYIVPAINPTVSYITSFEDIDIAIGFNNTEEIKEYIGVTKELPYDILLIDVDMPQKIEQFQLENAEKNYFVTSFDVYSLKRGLESIDTVENPIKLTKVYMSNQDSRDDDEYVNFLSMGYKVEWEKYKVYFPVSLSDKDAIVENQKINKIKFSNVSQQYKNSIQYITEEITKEIVTQQEIKKTIKLVEKEE